MATFEERLLELRNSKGDSQEKLGKAIGTKRYSIYVYESGKNKPDYTKLVALADYFNVSLDYLVGRSDHRDVIR